jgi:hypothetical protein
MRSLHQRFLDQHLVNMPTRWSQRTFLSSVILFATRNTLFLSDSLELLTTVGSIDFSEAKSDRRSTIISFTRPGPQAARVNDRASEHG